MKTKENVEFALQNLKQELNELYRQGNELGAETVKHHGTKLSAEISLLEWILDDSQPGGPLDLEGEQSND